MIGENQNINNENNMANVATLQLKRCGSCFSVRGWLTLKLIAVDLAELKQMMSPVRIELFVKSVIKINNYCNLPMNCDAVIVKPQKWAMKIDELFMWFHELDSL